MSGRVLRSVAQSVQASAHAVCQFGELNPDQSRAVEMRRFGGLSVKETAEALGISLRTVKRHWAPAKAWLHAELSGRGVS